MFSDERYETNVRLLAPYYEWRNQVLQDYNRRDVLLSKLKRAEEEYAAANSAIREAQYQLDRAEQRSDKAFEAVGKIRRQLDDLDVVKVVYLDPSDNVPLQAREPFDYIDGTGKGLHVGDVVVAPTRYNRYQRGVVVQIGGPRTYFGRLNKITAVLFV